MQYINIDQFIKTHITKRQASFFEKDLLTYKEQLTYQIKDKKILVIGGAGTIGSSYIKAILPYLPASLIVVDYSENGLTELTRDLRSQSMTMPSEYLTYPFDFGSSVFEKMFLSRDFDIVACFAAHKHVRSEKDHLAIEAMVRNNVFNTQKLIDLCMIKKPKHFFSVSTDKAANPVNVMGASKKLMEEVMLAHNDELKICTARFANVAFSNGSLLAGFLERIMKRQPLSAPNDVKRYFVSPEESGQLCLLASILGNSGEIFFPKLTEDQMLTFSEIADAFLKELGVDVVECGSEVEAKEKANAWETNMPYPVYYFQSDTSGEKQFEEFYADIDEIEMQRFQALGVIKNVAARSIQEVKNIQEDLVELFDKAEINKANIVSKLSEIIQGFDHIETGKRLDDKM